MMLAFGSAFHLYHTVVSGARGAITHSVVFRVAVSEIPPEADKALFRSEQVPRLGASSE